MTHKWPKDWKAPSEKQPEMREDHLGFLQGLLQSQRTCCKQLSLLLSIYPRHSEKQPFLASLPMPPTEVELSPPLSTQDLTLCPTLAGRVRTEGPGQGRHPLGKHYFAYSCPHDTRIPTNGGDTASRHGLCSPKPLWGLAGKSWLAIHTGGP